MAHAVGPLSPIQPGGAAALRFGGGAWIDIEAGTNLNGTRIAADHLRLAVMRAIDALVHAGGEDKEHP